MSLNVKKVLRRAEKQLQKLGKYGNLRNEMKLEIIYKRVCKKRDSKMGAGNIKNNVRVNGNEPVKNRRKRRES